jgi:hypothetical protein
MGKRNYSAESVLNGLCFDLQRMIREKQSKKVILNLLRKKLNFLQDGDKWHHVVWWEEKPTSRMMETPKLSVLQELSMDQDYEEDVFVG